MILYKFVHFFVLFFYLSVILEYTFRGSALLENDHVAHLHSLQFIYFFFSPPQWNASKLYSQPGFFLIFFIGTVMGLFSIPNSPCLSSNWWLYNHCLLTFASTVLCFTLLITLIDISFYCCLGSATLIRIMLPGCLMSFVTALFIYFAFVVYLSLIIIRSLVPFSMNLDEKSLLVFFFLI